MTEAAPEMVESVRLPLPRISAGRVGGVVLLLIAVPCLVTLPWSIARYDQIDLSRQYEAPNWSEPLGRDQLGRSLTWRALLGGAISLGVGLAAAGIAVSIGVVWGATAGYLGGRVDSALMRIVDVLYGLPYILLVVLLDFALTPVVSRVVDPAVADVTTLLLAIGSVSWLTMARVVRGQVLSLKAQPFVEASRACGAGTAHVMRRHLLPNLVGPIIVYTTLTVPTAILQESFLSFLGIGIQPPVPSWGNLASEGLEELHALISKEVDMHWWLVFWPCTLLGLTLLALNFLGDALRARWDPRTTR